MRGRLAILFIAVAALSGCATFSVQSAYRGEGASGQAPVRVELAKEINGARDVRVTWGALPEAVLRGQATADGSGGWKIELLRLDWFNNWQDGWTEAGFVISGSFDLSQGGAEAQILLTDKPEIDAPIVATIRYYDDYLNGDKALQQFTRRWNRIQAYAEFLRSRFDESWYSNQGSVRRFLFPELYGYDQPPSPKHASVTVDSITWNTDYTKEVFPGNLRALRDSGTMLRDFQESQALWKLAFGWNDFWTFVIPVEVFHSIRS